LYDCVSSDDEQVVNIVSDVLKDDEFKEYVHVYDNIDIFGPMPSDLELCQIDVKKDISKEDDDIEDALNNNDEQIVTFFEAKDCINKIRQFLVINGCLDYRAVSGLENQLDSVKFKNLKQKKISDFLIC